MRPIKFRGKRLDNGEWVYGSLIDTPNSSCIFEGAYGIQFKEPEYHNQGMGCGLEDKNITDRYDAMYHGWEKAIGRCIENHPEFVEVDPKTVGQSTGLKDKDGKDLDWWEGDLFSFPNGHYKIVFQLGCFWFIRDFLNQSVSHRYFCHEVLAWTEIPKKIGTIHDKPALLGKESDGEKISQ